MRVGYACICLGQEDLRCQRTTVLRNATPERLRSLIGENIRGLEGILRYNEAHDIRLFRLGNAFVPFASHPVNQIRWWEEFAPDLRCLGEWVRRHAHRLSFHASHFTILNSRNPEVAEASIHDLIYSCRVLDAMELGPEHKVIVHAGVATPSYQEAEARFVEAVEGLPDPVRRRLAVENDDRFYSADRVIGLAQRAGLPVVLDVFHHACLPGEWGDMPCAELLARAFATWRPQERPPKIHFSTQDPQKRTGAHDHQVDPEELKAFLEESAAVAQDFDIMFEAKGKDLAVEAVMPLLRQDRRFGLSAASGYGREPDALPQEGRRPFLTSRR